MLIVALCWSRVTNELSDGQVFCSSEVDHRRSGAQQVPQLQQVVCLTVGRCVCMSFKMCVSVHLFISLSRVCASIVLTMN